MDLNIVDGKVFIPKSEVNANHQLAFRIFDKGEMVDYKSTRLGTITSDGDGVSLHCDEKFNGCDFEIKDLQSKKNIEGKLLKKSGKAKEVPENKSDVKTENNPEIKNK